MRFLKYAQQTKFHCCASNLVLSYLNLFFFSTYVCSCCRKVEGGTVNTSQPSFRLRNGTGGTIGKMEEGSCRLNLCVYILELKRRT